MIVLGSFFVLSLVLAVLVDAYQGAYEQEHAPGSTVGGLLKDVGLNIGLGLGLGVDIQASRVVNSRFVSIESALKMVTPIGQGEIDGYHLLFIRQDMY